MTYELTLGRLGTSSAYRIDEEILGNFFFVETRANLHPFLFLQRDPQHAIVYSMDSQKFVAPPESVPEEETLLSMAAGPFTANRSVAAFQQELADWKIHQGFQTHRDAQVRAPQVTRRDRSERRRPELGLRPAQPLHERSRV